jgi:hypothetical protein
MTMLGGVECWTIVLRISFANSLYTNILNFIFVPLPVAAWNQFGMDAKEKYDGTLW